MSPHIGKELRSLILTFISMLDCTSDVERTFASLQFLEMKRRERHCSPQSLTDQLMVYQEVPHEIDALVVREPATAKDSTRLAAGEKALVTKLLWKPGNLLCKAMKKYAEFYGSRRLTNRSQETAPKLAPRPRLQGPRGSTASSKKSMRDRWNDSVKELVKKHRRAEPESKDSEAAKSKSALPEETRKIQKETLAALDKHRAQERSKHERSEQISGLAPPVAPLRRARQQPRLKRKNAEESMPRKKPCSRGMSGGSAAAKPSGAAQPIGMTSAASAEMDMVRAVAEWRARYA